MARPRIDAAKREAIADTIRAAEGTRSTGSIAKEHGVSRTTVHRIAHEFDLDGAWERSQTVNATRARTIDLADARTRLQERWLAKANEGLDRSENPCVVYSFGGMDNHYAEHTLDLPPAGDYRSFVTAAAVATDKMLALAKHDLGGAGVDEAKGLILGMAEGLRSMVDAVDETQP
jgi:hypothetical protein